MSRPPMQINLLRGWPSPDILPASLLLTSCQRALSDPAEYTPMLQYGPDAGHETLREGLAQWLGRFYGVEPDYRRIGITGGASQNIARILQSYTDPAYTRAIWIVEPCYHLVCAIFDDAGFAGRLHAVPSDNEGINVGILQGLIEEFDSNPEPRQQFQASQEPPGTTQTVEWLAPLPGIVSLMCGLQSFKMTGPARKVYRHVIHCVPTFSNPTGISMSLRRREALVRLARRHDALVICDDVYDFLQWPLQEDFRSKLSSEIRLPRLCDIDLLLGRADNNCVGFGYAVSNGSFSKIAGPGMRTGWIEASPAFVQGLSRTGSTLSGGAPSQLCAGLLSYLVTDGRLERHINEVVRPSLRRRHQIMMSAIRQHILPLGVQVMEPNLMTENVYGGYFIWIKWAQGQLPPSRLIADAAFNDANLIIAPGHIFEVSRDARRARFDREIRLCFAWEDEDALTEGVQRLGDLLKRMQENQPEHEGRAASEPQSLDVTTN